MNDREQGSFEPGGPIVRDGTRVTGVDENGEVVYSGTIRIPDSHACGYRDALAQVAIRIKQEAMQFHGDDVEVLNLLGRLDSYVNELHQTMRSQKP